VYKNKEVRYQVLLVHITSDTTEKEEESGPNLRPKAARLEVRINFFSYGVLGDNKVPPELKRSRTVKSFKNGYAEHRAKLVVST
jgi:hypothetical protein